MDRLLEREEKKKNKNEREVKEIMFIRRVCATFWSCYGCPSGKKRALLMDGIAIQITRKIHYRSFHELSLLFVYSFSQITCEAFEVPVDFKNATIQRITCSQFNTRFIDRETRQLTSSIISREQINPLNAAYL